MKQKLFLIFGFAFMVGLLVLLNALSVKQQAEVADSELDPDRSTYNTDSTGLHAFYTLLSETGRNTVRWQQKPSALNAASSPKTFVIAAPLKKELTDAERREILRWVARGGKLVVIDRTPDVAFLFGSGDTKVEAEPLRPGLPIYDPEALKEPTKDVAPGFPVQPTIFTNAVGSIQPSRFGSYVNWPLPDKAKETEKENAAPPMGSGLPEKSEFDAEYSDSGDLVADIRTGGKAVVVSRTFGAGRIVILTDPFVLSNRGISLLDNAQLGVNMVAAGKNGTIAFDEYHHGFGANENRVVEYFKGTPVVAIFLQIFLVAGVILFSQSRRFARPLEVKEPDRLTKLEYLSAMAELQRRTHSYDLAVENVYREFRRRSARLVGLDPRTASNADLARLVAARAGRDANDVAELFSTAEDVMHDVSPDRAEATRVVVGIRELEAALNLTRRKGTAK
ncbi:MAG: hypothetical protein UZ17_ACD001001890 [Acidobacteria bacterium OLB17]|nr:MAG: hypothetical protein UZ17_ACD001001890 [Acidobacteria bacterium OLB17]MCZ2390225.1 DUF4350 domain-containing protein [Acidobacteriota bacterium]